MTCSLQEEMSRWRW